MNASSLAALYGVPYWLRAAALAAIMLLTAGLERLFRRERATRWREYLAWLCMATLGAAYGVCNDLITSHIAPEYFEYGKGLDPNASDFLWQVADLGAQAGSSAGLALGAIMLVANNPRPGKPSLGYRRLVAPALLPLAFAAWISPLASMLERWDPQHLGPHLRGTLSDVEISNFLAVQRAHLGAYAGAALGVAWAVTLIRRRRAFQERSSADRPLKARAVHSPAPRPAESE